MNTLESCIIASPNNKSEECAKFTIVNANEHFLLASITKPGKEYTFSFWGKSEEAGSINTGGKLFDTSDTWEKYVVTFTAKEENFTISFPTTGTYYIYHAQLENGNKATDWTPSPIDVDTSVKEAAKTASNFIDFTEENGLQIGNKTGGAWEGFRTQITSVAFNILSAAGETLASYGARLVELGKNAEGAIISMCGGKGKMSTTNIAGTSYFDLSSHRVRLVGSDGSSGSATVQGGANSNLGQVHASGGAYGADAGIIACIENENGNENDKLCVSSLEMRADINNKEDGTKSYESRLEGRADHVVLIASKDLFLKSNEGDVEIQNVKFGNADISNIGDGTLLGAIAALYEQLNS